MTLRELLEKMKNELLKRKQQLALDLIDGRVSDFESYQRNVGKAEGLMDAHQVIDDIYEKLDKEDE